MLRSSMIYVYVLLHILRRYCIYALQRHLYILCPRYYPTPTGYVHVAVCCIRRYSGAIKFLLRLYSGPIKALLRLYQGAIIYICVYIYGYVCVFVCVCV
jgi:hypothetical protein